VTEDNQWRIRTSAERDKLYMDVNIGTFIKPQRRRWIGRRNARNTKEVFQNNLHQTRLKGIRKGKWKDDVENDAWQMGIVNWREVAQDGDG